MRDDDQRDMPITRRRFVATASATVSTAALPLGDLAAAAASRSIPPLAEGPSTGKGWPRRPLLTEAPGTSLNARMLAKPVSASRAVPGLKDARLWRTSKGATAALTQDHAPGRPDVARFTSLMLNEEAIAASRLPNGSFSGGPTFLAEGRGANFWHIPLEPRQDWSAFTRLSFEVFVHDTGYETYSFGLGFVADDQPPQLPSGGLPFTFIHDLVPGRWNRVVWEFPELARGAVGELAFWQPTRGPKGHVIYDIDSVEVQAVDPEAFQGWDVAAGRIAFNHLGYAVGGEKIALVASGSAPTFDLLDDRSSHVVATLPVAALQTRIGAFGQLDFSAVETPGRYRLRCGAVESRAFTITTDPLAPLVDALTNYFYANRCGFPVPGIHNACHCDNRGEHEGVRKFVNGGWHDAGNGAQGHYRTAGCTEGLLHLYEELSARQDAAAPRVLEEACWGLDWMLRSRFGKGYRTVHIDHNIYTDNILGTIDDIIDPAELDHFESFLFTHVAARAAMLLARVEPDRARKALAAAREDYAVSRQAYADGPPPPRRPNPNSASAHQEYAYGVLAAVALHAATKEASYLDDAVSFAALLLACQEQSPVGESDVTGYWYEDERRATPAREFHTSFADAPPRALEALCAALPDHPRRIDWQAALALQAKRFWQAGSRYNAPYNYPPTAVWTETQFTAFLDRASGFMGREPPPSMRTPYIGTTPVGEGRAAYRREFEAAASLGGGARLRTFPMPMEPVFHGGTTIQLAATAGMTAAARALTDPALEALALRQLDWLLGLNPFSTSLVYGVGYDYHSQFQLIARNMVGAIPVGMDYLHDRPFWPNANHFTFKEMWVVPAGKLVHVAAHFLSRAIVSGDAPVGAIFRHRASGVETIAKAGHFRLALAAGDYEIRFARARIRRTFVHGRDHTLALDPARFLSLRLETARQGDDHRLIAHCEGKGAHNVSLRLWNAQTVTSDVTIDPAAHPTHEWAIVPIDRAKSWMALVKSGAETLTILSDA